MRSYLYNIVEELRYMRIQQGITMMELRDKTGVSQKHISEIENHKAIPTVETLNKLAQGIGMDLKIQLLREEDSNEQNGANGKAYSGARG